MLTDTARKYKDLLHIGCFIYIDCCAGSGTTLLAAANLNRRAYGFELMKEYVNGFYKKILPMKQIDLFAGVEKQEKDVERLKKIQEFNFQ